MTVSLPGTIADWTSLVTSQHIQKPNYIATINGSLQPFGDQRATSLAQYTYFSVSTAVGQQLDMIGDIVVATRLKQFPGGPYTMTDTEFRAFVKMQIAANFWDGTISSAYQMWTSLFGNIPFWIQDFGDSTMAIVITPWGNANLPAVITVMLYNDPTQFYLRPAGVRIRYVGYLPISPAFGWGVTNTSVAGWGTGRWINILGSAEQW